jgi:ABC-type proline/glycine betaine transport system ATPase subunit
LVIALARKTRQKVRRKDTIKVFRHFTLISLFTVTAPTLINLEVVTVPQET